MWISNLLLSRPPRTGFWMLYLCFWSWKGTALGLMLVDCNRTPPLMQIHADLVNNPTAWQLLWFELKAVVVHALTQHPQIPTKDK